MPSYKIQIEQRALLDIRQACNYYEEQQPGLGVRFNQSVFHSFDALSNNFLSGPLRFFSMLACQEISIHDSF
jgi:hypothetical protein